MHNDSRNEKVASTIKDMPEAKVYTHESFNEIIASCKACEPCITAVVHPVKPDIIKAVEDCVNERLIIPILVGPKARIVKAAKEASIDIKKYRLIETEHSDAAALMAQKLAASGEVEAIMKGAITTAELLRAIVPASSNLRTKYRMSHAYIMNVPTYHKPLIITDAALNIAPDAMQKADICQNAINLWRVLFGWDKKPKVAILAATEFINIKMQATVDAAILCKMLDRKQIVDGILDGPLALDNAINKKAAKNKAIVSDVAGDADILLVPDIESGNILAKQLTFLNNADAAGIVLGARVPIILFSRSDSLRTKILSCALAIKMIEAKKTGKIK